MEFLLEEISVTGLSKGFFKIPITLKVLFTNYFSYFSSC
jgi:hypothetical protein